MKKKYAKPMIVFEDMELNSAIASCSSTYVADYWCEIEMVGLEGNSRPYETIDGEIYYANNYRNFCKDGEYYCYQPGIGFLNSLS